MKKLWPVAVLFFALIGSSCKRQYECTCNRMVNNLPGDDYTYAATGNSPIDACDAVDDAYVMGSDSVVVNCEPM